MRDQDQDAKKDEPAGELEGEGSRSAAEKYDKELDEFKKKSDIEELADEAAKELDDDETSSQEGDTKAA